MELTYIYTLMVLFLRRALIQLGMSPKLGQWECILGIFLAMLIYSTSLNGGIQMCDLEWLLGASSEPES